MNELKLNTELAGKKARLIVGPVVNISCEIVGSFPGYIRVKLLEHYGCHFKDDIVDFGSRWIKME